MSNTSMPEGVNSYDVYDEEANMMGTAEVQLPDFESLTVSVKGAGIAGDEEVPMKGLFGSQVTTLNWRSVTEAYFKLMKQNKAHALNLYSSLQEYDSATGETLDTQLHVYIKGRTKKSGLGKFTTGESQDASTEIETNYIKVEKEGREMIEYDKRNYVYKVMGEDQLAKVRNNLGRG